MAEMVVCKSCGFIMEKGKVRDRCPACGVPAKMFLPHDERISPRRKFLLALEIHPVLVHFPQAFTTTLLLLSIAGPALNRWSGNSIAATVRVLGLLLPFTLALSIAAGLFDGKIRFRKVTTPLLKRKTFLGILFLLFSAAAAACVLILPQGSSRYFLATAACSLPALGCAVILGLIGSSLHNARFPG